MILPVPDAARAQGAGAAGTADLGNLRRAGAKGALWQGLAQVLGKSAVLVTTVVLARLLVPAQFGLVSLALVLITYAEAIADVGVAQALVYLPRSRANVRAALVCSLAFGCLLFAVALLVAPGVADLFHRADVTPLVRLLALTLPAAAVSAVPEALLRRDLRFQRLTVATVGRALVTGTVSIGLGLAGAGAYSLAWGSVFGAVSYAAVTWALVDDRPGIAVWQTSRQELRAVLRYGVPVASGTLLAKLVFDVDYLIIGALLGAKALAFYTLAFRLPELLIINVFFVLSAVTFPLYSRARDNPERLRRGYLLSVRLQSLYGVCAGVGLAIIAPLIVPVLFGEAWRPSVEPLVGLALYASCRSLGAGANDVYKALGRPGLSVALSVARLVVLVPALILACRVGIDGVAWSQLITSALFTLLLQSVAVRVVGVSYSDLGRAVAPGIVAGVAITAVALPLQLLPIGRVPGLVLTVAGGVTAAAVALAVLFPSALREVSGAWRQRTQTS